MEAEVGAMRIQARGPRGMPEPPRLSTSEGTDLPAPGPQTSASRTQAAVPVL